MRASKWALILLVLPVVDSRSWTREHAAKYATGGCPYPKEKSVVRTATECQAAAEQLGLKGGFRGLVSDNIEMIETIEYWNAGCFYCDDVVECIHPGIGKRCNGSDPAQAVKSACNDGVWFNNDPRAGRTGHSWAAGEAHGGGNGILSICSGGTHDYIPYITDTVHLLSDEHFARASEESLASPEYVVEDAFCTGAPLATHTAPNGGCTKASVAYQAQYQGSYFTVGSGNVTSYPGDLYVGFVDKQEFGTLNMGAPDIKL